MAPPCSFLRIGWRGTTSVNLLPSSQPQCGPLLMKPPRRIVGRSTGLPASAPWPVRQKHWRRKLAPCRCCFNGWSLNRVSKPCRAVWPSPAQRARSMRDQPTRSSPRKRRRHRRPPMRTRSSNRKRCCGASPIRTITHQCSSPGFQRSTARVRPPARSRA